MIQTSEGFAPRPAFSPIFCFRKHGKRCFERISRRHSPFRNRRFLFGRVRPSIRTSPSVKQTQASAMVQRPLRMTAISRLFSKSSVEE
jgi:hypothetical protein